MDTHALTEERADASSGISSAAAGGAGRGAARGELADLVDGYQLSAGDLHRWLTPLRLEAPRRNLHCLPWTGRAVKRCVDVAGASILLVLLAPVMLTVAALVRLTSRGPAIYRQTRVGLNLRSSRRDRREFQIELPEGFERRRPGRRDRRVHHAYGRHFTMYKFRTMRVDAEKDGARFAVEGDPRVTPIGRFLRRTRLDELPQLWNVLRGDMSLVGPRPERPEFVEELSREVEGYLDRLGLRPGITGLAQVINGYDNEIESFRRKVALDLVYLQNCCLWNDLKIMLRTVGVVLTGKGSL